MNQTEVTYPEGDEVPELTYTVQVDPEEQAESEWTVTGTVVVNNPNAAAFPAQLVDTVDNGGACTLHGGASGVVVQPGENAFDYTCVYDSAPANDAGTSTATLSWEPAAMPGTSGSVESSAAFDFGEVDPYPVINESITVLDPQAPESPWTVTWPEDGETITDLTYTVPAVGTPGECRAVDNTATISETGQSADTVVDICVGQDIEVTKNVILGLERTYLWTLGKDVEETSVTVDPATGEATFDYTVTATPAGHDDANWRMRGEVDVRNPNAWQDVEVTVTDAVTIESAVCQVAGGDNVAVVPAGQTLTLEYVCTITDVMPDEYNGTNTATATWDAEAASTPTGDAMAEVAFAEEDWDVTPINETGHRVGDKTDPANPVELGTAAWNAEGASTEFSYSVTQLGVPGDCVTFTNTAWIEATGQQASQDVEACGVVDLSVTKSVVATHDRTYHWSIAKAADETDVTVDPETGLATVGYEVVVDSAAPAFTDSGHALSGTIR